MREEKMFFTRDKSRHTRYFRKHFVRFLNKHCLSGEPFYKYRRFKYLRIYYGEHATICVIRIHTKTVRKVIVYFFNSKEQTLVLKRVYRGVQAWRMRMNVLKECRLIKEKNLKTKIKNARLKKSNL